MKFATFASLVTLAVASTVPVSVNDRKVDQVIDVSNNTDASGLEKRTLGNVFLCLAAGFQGFCVLITGEASGQCVDLAINLDDQVSSFGPDPGQDCFIFSNHGCTGRVAGPIEFPGVSDLNQPFNTGNGVSQPFNDDISSYQCFF